MNKITDNIINRIKKDKKLLFIMILGFLGMLLLLASGFSAEKSGGTADVGCDMWEIQDKIEKELTELLKSVEGAGKVRVMVTVDCLEERVFAQNTESGSDNDSYELKTEYVLTENSGDTDGLTVKLVTPVIRGVGISCEGAVSDVMKLEIKKLVCSALGISENKVWVSKMQE